MSRDSRGRFIGRIPPVSKTLRDLKAEIVHVAEYSWDDGFTYYGYEESWQGLYASLDHLRGKLGDNLHRQLVEMADQAKAHYAHRDDDTEKKLGLNLMQDMEEVIMGHPPFSYPCELYRWPRANEEGRTSQ